MLTVVLLLTCRLLENRCKEAIQSAEELRVRSVRSWCSLCGEFFIWLVSICVGVVVCTFNVQQRVVGISSSLCRFLPRLFPCRLIGLL